LFRFRRRHVHIGGLDHARQSGERLGSYRDGCAVGGAGHALTKHATGQRAGSSAFPALSGNPAQINATAQGILDDILTAPGSVVVPKTSGNFAGGFEVIAPDGRKAVFDANNIFQYFGE
jgi:hypothetical protein